MQIRSVMMSYCLQLNSGKSWINNISGNIEAVFLKLGTTNVHQKRNKMTPLVEIMQWHVFANETIRNSPLQKHESTGASFSYWLDWDNVNTSAEIFVDEKLLNQVQEFSAKNCPNGSLAKVAKFHTNPYNFLACLPNPYKLSILGDIWRPIILPFSSYAWFISVQPRARKERHGVGAKTGLRRRELVKKVVFPVIKV